MNELLDIKQIAKRYNVTKTTIQNWKRKGILPEGLKIGGKRLWRISEIEEYERRLQA